MTHQASIEAALNPTAIVSRESFDKAISIVNEVVEKKNTIPILSNVFLAAEAGMLKMVGTDLDVEITVRVDGDVDGRFETTLPAALLKSMGSNAPKSDRVVLTALPEDGNTARNIAPSDRCTVEFGKAKYTLNSLYPQDFPKLEGKVDTADFKMTGSVIWNALDSVKGAISTEETRYYLNGIYLHVHSDGELRAVATDGHRMYCQKMELPDGADSMPAVILPRQTVLLLHKLWKGKSCPEKVRIRAAERHIVFSWGNIEVKTKTIDGTFPDYHRVIPTQNSKVAQFVAKHLDDGIKAVTVMETERGRAVKLTLSKGQALRLDVHNPEHGTARMEVAGEYESDDLEIGFNSTYLRGILADACPGGGYVTMKFSDSGSPTVISGTMNGWFSVLMPMRV